MKHRVALGCVAACLLCSTAVDAQTNLASSPVTLPSAPLFGSTVERPTESFFSPFREMPGDFARFFSTDTVKLLSLGGATALAAHQWDARTDAAREQVQASAFRAGNVGGSFLMQTGAAVGLYSVAKVAGSATLSRLGGDLMRAQALSQGIVQAGKLATRRQRPDASNDHSLPSGHTASAFASATVLNSHFGWKVGVPAYGFGAYVAASRMSANKHHLSDVVMGALVGITAGRTVTFGSGSARFGMGVAPASRGAVLTFTKK
jgi:hypothetical protein